MNFANFNLRYLAVLLFFGSITNVLGQYKADDLVVVRKDLDLQVPGKAVIEVKRGNVLKIESVKGSWLWVRKGKPGWIHVNNVMSGELQGTWIVESAKQAGRLNEEAVGDKVVFTGLTMSIEPKVKKAPPQMTVSLNRTHSPKQIDLVFTRDEKKHTVKGVYSVQDDTLRLCISPPNTSRPEALESQADTKQVSLVMKPAEVVLSTPEFTSIEPLLGEIRIAAFTFAQRGWARCDGQILQIKEHQALFSLLGTTYGGDGRTTFALPDLRGRVPVHAGEVSNLPKVVQGQRYGGEQVALSDDGKGATIRPYQGLNYVIALKGYYPSRTESNDTGRFLGEIRMFAGTFAPKGWAYCDGQQLVISENKGLFAEIGKTYGGNDTEFSLPDLRGRVPSHAGQGPGLAAVKQGEAGDGKLVAKGTDPDKSVSTCATLAIRYLIALEGVDPERKGVDSYISEVRMLAGKSTPRGWKPCDGQILPISQYEAGFSLVGTIYGGDGRKTFALPGLRGRTPIHAGQGAEISKVRMGQRGGGLTAVTTTNGDDAVRTQAHLGIRYIISVWGVYPSRS